LNKVLSVILPTIVALSVLVGFVLYQFWAAPEIKL